MFPLVMNCRAISKLFSWLTCLLRGVPEPLQVADLLGKLVPLTVGVVRKVVVKPELVLDVLVLL